MKTPQDIVQELYETKFVQNYVRKRFMGSPYQEDVIQDVFEMLLIWPRLQEVYKQKGINGIRAVSSGMIQRHLSVKGLGSRLYVRNMRWCDNEIKDIPYEPDYTR